MLKLIETKNGLNVTFFYRMRFSKQKLGFDEGITSWDLKFGFLAKNYIYSFIPRSKLADSGQNTSTRMF